MVGFGAFYDYFYIYAKIVKSMEALEGAAAPPWIRHCGEEYPALLTGVEWEENFGKH